MYTNLYELTTLIWTHGYTSAERRHKSLLQLRRKPLSAYIIIREIDSLSCRLRENCLSDTEYVVIDEGLATDDRIDKDAIILDKRMLSMLTKMIQSLPQQPPLPLSSVISRAWTQAIFSNVAHSKLVALLTQTPKLIGDGVELINYAHSFDRFPHLYRNIGLPGQMCVVKRVLTVEPYPLVQRPLETTELIEIYHIWRFVYIRTYRGQPCLKPCAAGIYHIWYFPITLPK